MRRTMLATAVALLGFALAAQAQQGCGGCQPMTEEQPCGGCRGGSQMEVKVSVIEPMTAATMMKTGPYEKVGETMDALFRWVRGKGVEVTGPAFGVYHDNPETVPPESTRFEAGIPVPEGTEGDEAAGVVVKTWGGRLAARTVYTGPYDRVGPTYGLLGEWVFANGYCIAGPAVEFYLNDPAKVPAESLQTEVCFMVEEARVRSEQ